MNSYTFFFLYRASQ